MVLPTLRQLRTFVGATHAWDCCWADASSAAMVVGGFDRQKELTKMQLDNQKELSEMRKDTSKEICALQVGNSRQNSKDQLKAQNEIFTYQEKEISTRV